MRYADPLLFARRITRHRRPDGLVEAVYRSNPLNPRAIWGQPVPTAPGHCLAFETYIAPLEAYLTVFDLTDHYPDDHPPERITCTVVPHAKVYGLLALDQISDAAHQENLRSIRDDAVVRTYTRLRDRGPTTTPDTTRFNALNTTAARMCISTELVRKVLTERGIPVPVAAVNTAQRAPSDREPHRFSTSHEHGPKWKTLTKIVQYRRNASRGETKFILADLHSENCAGGYPTHCPATGEELSWDTNTSWYSPSIGRYDTTEPYVSGNVVIMSKLGRYLTQKKAIAQLPAILKTLPEIKDHYEAWREKHPTASPMPTPVPRRRRGAETD
jgi:hypothetical protein